MSEARRHKRVGTKAPHTGAHTEANAKATDTAVQKHRQPQTATDSHTPAYTPACTHREFVKHSELVAQGIQRHHLLRRRRHHFAVRAGDGFGARQQRELRRLCENAAVLHHLLHVGPRGLHVVDHVEERHLRLQLLEERVALRHEISVRAQALTHHERILQPRHVSVVVVGGQRDVLAHGNGAAQLALRQCQLRQRLGLRHEALAHARGFRSLHGVA